MSKISPLAYIDPRAQLGANVVVGPFCHVGENVVLGEDCELISHVTLLGDSRFGPRNVFYPNCVLGAAPQDLKYRGGPTRLQVGSDNVFRENVTVHRGTEVDVRSGGVTHIGDRNLLMVGVHVAHDCEIGDHIILANYVQLAGHVKLENYVNVGGSSAMHHFVTVGRNAFIAGMTRITHDAPPYMKIEGYDQQVRAVNATGLQRWGVPPESVRAIRSAFRLLYARRGDRSPGRIVEALREIEGNGLTQDPHVHYLAAFLKRKLEKGVYGRAREADRTDSHADIRKFYDVPAAESSA